MSKTIRVAAIQMDCKPGDSERNLVHAYKLVHSAVAKGAELVLLPELMPSGYLTTEDIWKSAETINGKSVKWLLATAKHFGVYLGFSFLEADTADFYNSFVLSSPEGKLLGRVRKNPPASVEAYFYKAGSDSHVIETEIGRIGISICYEGLLYEQICFLHENKIDLMLWPAAAARPKKFIPGDIKRFEKTLICSRSIYSKTLAVPIIMANRTGSLETDLPGIFPYLKSSFPGLSFIADSDGTIRGELGEEEDIIVADVCINSNEEHAITPKRYGKMWAVPVPWYAFTWPLSQKMGERSYKANSRRKVSALLVSQK